MFQCSLRVPLIVVAVDEFQLASFVHHDVYKALRFVRAVDADLCAVSIECEFQVVADSNCVLLTHKSLLLVLVANRSIHHSRESLRSGVLFFFLFSL